jgi:hypothetical protein
MTAVTPVMIVRDRISLIDRSITSRRGICLVLAQVLAKAVEHDDGVVHRIADDGQDGRDHVQAELQPHQDDQAKDQDDVVEQAGHGAEPNCGSNRNQM